MLQIQGSYQALILKFSKRHTIASSFFEVNWKEARLLEKEHVVVKYTTVKKY